MLLGRHVKCLDVYLLGIQPLLEIVQTYMEFEVSEEDVKFFSHLDVFFSLHSRQCPECSHTDNIMEGCVQATDLFLSSAWDTRKFRNIYPQLPKLGLKSMGNE